MPFIPLFDSDFLILNLWLQFNLTQFQKWICLGWSGDFSFPLSIHCAQVMHTWLVDVYGLIDQVVLGTWFSQRITKDSERIFLVLGWVLWSFVILKWYKSCTIYCSSQFLAQSLCHDFHFSGLFLQGLVSLGLLDDSCLTNACIGWFGRWTDVWPNFVTLVWGILTSPIAY